MNDLQWRELVEATKRGDKKAFEELYRETERSVYFTCLKLLANEDSAKDAMQDTFMTALDKLDTLDDGAKFPKWINRIAVNKSMDKSEAEAQEFAKTVNRDYMAHAQIAPSYTGTNGTKGAVMQAGNLSVLVPSDWYISGKGYGRYDGENTVGLYSITPHFDYHFVTKDEKGIKTNSEKLLERLKKDPKSEYESIEEFECGGRKWFGYKFKEPLGVTGVYVDAFTVYTVGEGDNSLEVTGLSTAYDTDLSKDMLEAVKVVKENK